MINRIVLFNILISVLLVIVSSRLLFAGFEETLVATTIVYGFFITIGNYILSKQMLKHQNELDLQVKKN